MVELRQAAKLQGLDSVKVWACNQGCYDNSLIEQGGADVEGTYSVLTTLPFFTEYKSNSSLRSLVQQVGGVDKTFSNAVSSCVAALLFQDAAGKAVANGGTLTRQSLLGALKNEHAFDAQGTTGPTDAGNRVPPTCIVMAQVKNGKWTRAYPARTGAFDCNKRNRRGRQDGHELNSTQARLTCDLLRLPTREGKTWNDSGLSRSACLGCHPCPSSSWPRTSVCGTSPSC